MSCHPHATRTRLVDLGWSVNASPRSMWFWSRRATTWQHCALDWYGQGERTLEICTGTALWYREGHKPLPIRWVLTRDPQGKRPPKALFSTNQTLTAEEIVWTFMRTLESGNDF